MQTWNQYIDANKERFLEELIELLSIPSVSTDAQYKENMQKCSSLIKRLLLSAGCDTATVYETKKYPMVVGERIIDPGKPTVLVYGHYDVQPPDPLELWHTDPFKPVIKNGQIIARGASDDKGQLFMHIKALEIMTRTNTLPCNIKFIIEGEEEIGSISFDGFVKDHKEELKADTVLISDTAMLSMESPSIESALRGMAYLQVELTGPKKDLHSGVYGGAVANPITILCQLIASLHDVNNRITIKGFYDKVKEVSEKERKRINEIPFDLDSYKKELGIEEIWGESGYTTVERVGIRPSLDVNGIWGGYTGIGAKTVLPAKAFAKISMRLVPDQQPEEIAGMFREHFTKLCPPSMQIDIKFLHGGMPVKTPTDSHGYRAAVKAIKTTFGKEPYSVYSGGSIPVVDSFEKILGIHSVLLGFGLDNDNIHSPNEKFELVNFYKGIETILYFHKYFAEQ